ncbi:MAG: YbaK/EbsC family protein [Eubacteriales bacterium]|nr:YbaK/EbsC family protein [Eubacteriales bacterium]
MSFQEIKDYLTSLGLGDQVYELSESSATVELAAHAVGTQPCRIAKTMSFLVDGAPVLIVLAGDTKVDNSKFKALFHQKAVMLPLERVEELTGFPAGGVCPFMAAEGVKVYLDESLKRFDSVYPAAGSRNSAVKVTLSQLESASKADGWVNVGKLTQEVL